MATKLATIIADFTTQLASELAVGGTTATLSSATDDDGVALPSGRYFFTLDGANSKKEHISCDLAGTALTNIKTVSRQGVETAGVLRKHRIGASIGITDFAHILQINALLAGTTDLNYLVPLKYDGTASISDLKHLATKAYVDGIAIAGSPDATTATKGISKMSVAPVSAASPIAVGQNDPQFVNYFAETGAANAYVLTPSPSIGAYAVGQRFSFKATNANTTTSTLNINGLGAKTIYKGNGATALASGDIAANMIVTVEYDGTNFIMLNPVANAPTVVAPTTDVQAFTTATTANWTKPVGAKWVEVTVIGGGGAGGSGTPTRNGGGGGGAYGFKRFDASALGSTESYTVGAGGVAGANNSDGGSGGFSSFGTTVLIKAPGGSGGGASAGAGGVIGNGDIVYAGGAGNINGAAGIDTANVPSPRGGGGGGYNGGSPATATAGGNGGAFITNYVKAGGAGGSAGVNNGTAGSAASTGLIYGGVGGGGGGYNGNGTNTGGNGAAGAAPGGGGGGSTGTNNTGGNGAVGLVYVVTYF